MTREESKDALVAGASAAAAAEDLAPLASALLPAAVSGAIDIYFRLQDRRANRFWKNFIGSDTGASELARDVDLAIARGDERVAAMIIAAARTAAEAVDEVVVPAIGLLTRRFLRQDKLLEAWLFRGLLRVLTELLASEYANLQVFGRAVLSHCEANGMRRMGAFVEGDHLWESRKQGFDPVLIGIVSGPRRLFRLLKAHGLADDGEARIGVPAVDAIAIERVVAEHLTDVLV